MVVVENILQTVQVTVLLNVMKLFINQIMHNIHNKEVYQVVLEQHALH